MSPNAWLSIAIAVMNTVVFNVPKRVALHSGSSIVEPLNARLSIVVVAVIDNRAFDSGSGLWSTV